MNDLGEPNNLVYDVNTLSYTNRFVSTGNTWISPTTSTYYPTYQYIDQATYAFRATDQTKEQPLKPKRALYSVIIVDLETDSILADCVRVIATSIENAKLKALKNIDGDFDIDDLEFQVIHIMDLRDKKKDKSKEE